MTVHFFIDSSFPHGMAMAASKRRICYAKGLQKQGDLVLVHCTHKCVEKNEDDGLPEKGVYEGIPYNYISGKIKPTSKLMRGLHWVLLDSLRSCLYCLRHVHKGEIMYLYFYPVFLQIVLLLAGKIRGAKVVKETCEHPSAFGNPDSPVQKFSRWFEYHYVMPLYDGFIPISYELEKFVNTYKKKNARSIIVPILVEPDSFNLDYSTMKSPLPVPYIIHTGTMYEQKDSISKIIKAFARYKKEHPSDAKLVFTGPQANDDCKYIPLMEQYGIRDSVELVGMVSVKEVAVLQHFASMTIIYKSDNLQTRNCLPTKLGEMLVSGVPVIITSVGDSKLYLKHNESALFFDPDDEDALVAHIHTILSDKEYSHHLGERGRQVALSHFSPFFQGERLHSFFISLIDD